MAKARGFRNSWSCGVENKLKTTKLTARKISLRIVESSSRPWNE